MRPDAKDEVLRYLGHRGQMLGPEISERIDEAMAECRAISRVRHVLRRFPLERESGQLRVAGTDVLLVGETVERYLAGAKEIALLCATLGIEIETRIRNLQYSDMTCALLLDAAATEFIEEVCDGIEAVLCAQAMEEGLCTGSRFSPGYGDLPIELQASVLALTDAPRRIGLNRTDKYILIPQKSVTAFIGLFESEAGKLKPGCTLCSMGNDCAVRRRK